MKFKYNGETYVVFADIEEVNKTNYIVKIDEEYLLLHLMGGRHNVNKISYYLNKTLSTETTTTQVLEYVAAGNKILLAHKVQLIETYVNTYSNEYFTGEVEAIIDKLQEIKDCKITYNDTNYSYPFIVTLLTEATENQLQDIIRETCTDVKYYNP